MIEKKKAPKLRFPGFTDDWEQRKFSDIVEIGSGMDYKHLNEGNIPVYGTGGYMLSVDAALSYDKDAIGIGRKGTIDKPYILRAPFWTVDTLFYCIPKIDYDLEFTSCLFQNVNWKKKDESTGVPSLSKVIINNVKTATPSLDEQQKIGEYFSNLDNLITLHQRKLEHTKDLKKSMLQKMFPKKGEKNPEIRFPGFTDDWEQRKLGEVVSLRGRIGFRGYKESDLVAPGDGAITFSPADIDEMGNVSTENNKYLSWTKYDESPEIQVDVGDILFTKTASIGKIGYIKDLKEKATINPQFALLTPKENSNGYFTFLSVRSDSFMKQVRGITGGSSVPTMSQEKLKELVFMSPSLGEQQKIGEYFSNLDHLITLHQRELEHLKLLKKGLLQQMFI